MYTMHVAEASSSMKIGEPLHTILFTCVGASHGNLPHVKNFGNQVTLTRLRKSVINQQPDKQDFHGKQQRKKTCVVASGVYTWVRLNTVKETMHFSSVSQQEASDRLALTFPAVRAARSVSRNVTSDRKRSAKTLVGTSQINSLSSSGFTEPHASIERASVKSNTSKQQRRQPT
jgi:hypothetical protein